MICCVTTRKFAFWLMVSNVYQISISADPNYVAKVYVIYTAYVIYIYIYSEKVRFPEVPHYFFPGSKRRYVLRKGVEK